MIKRFRDVDDLQELVNYEKNINSVSEEATKNYIKNLQEVKKITRPSWPKPADSNCPLISFKPLNCDFHYQDGTQGEIQIFK